ncbi:Winged helix-turn-helix DNA-binding domain protein [Raphanus sativus]|nr:Winged helix-turn-helix DNA-binding domain protein [Raphanus sativus]
MVEGATRSTGNQNWTFSRSFNGRDGNAAKFTKRCPSIRKTSTSIYAVNSSSVYGCSPIQPLRHYLRGHMDDQGFVPLHVIAGFKKVAELTDSIQQIIEALQGSPFVEVQGDRIRKRYNWHHWLLPEETSHQSVDAMASGVRTCRLDRARPIHLVVQAASGILQKQKRSCFRWSATVFCCWSSEQHQRLRWCKPLNHHVWSCWLVLDMKYIILSCTESGKTIMKGNQKRERVKGKA